MAFISYGMAVVWTSVVIEVERFNFIERDSNGTRIQIAVIVICNISYSTVAGIKYL